MSKTRALAAMTILTASALHAAVNFTGPGGDVASASNWGGGVCPSETDEVTFPAANIPAGGLTLSDSVTFGKATFAAGAAKPIPFDLGTKAFTVSGALSLKSGVTFCNGAALAGGSYLFDNVGGLSFRVTDGATFTSTNYLSIVNSSDVSLTVGSGSSFDCANHLNYNIAFLVQGVTDAAMTFDNATARFYTVNVGGRESGALSPVSNLTWTVRNGSAVTFHMVGTSNSRGVYFGSPKAPGCSVSNRLVVTDSTFDVQNGGRSPSVRFYGIGDVLAVTNATFKAGKISVPNGTDCAFSFSNSTVTLGERIEFGSESSGNVLTVADCATFPSVTVDGTANRVVLESGTLAALPAFAGAGEGKAFEIAGGAMTNTTFAFSGTNVTLVVRDGGRLQYGAGNVTKNGFNFMPGATKDYTLRIADGGTVGIRGMVNFSGNAKMSYDWTNCPNSAIEFTGRNPSLVCHDYSSNYQTLGLGTEDEEALADAVKLRFVIPEGGYAAAPIRNEIANRNIWIWGNQPIEIRLADDFVPTEQVTVPLISDLNGFSSVPMDAERLAKLTANATFPDAAKYKTTLSYDSSSKTLMATIRPRRGLAVIIR